MQKTLFDFNDAWVKLCGKLYPENTLSETEKIWYYAQSFAGDVNNGGIISFFYNYGADNYLSVINSLNHLKAFEIKELLEKTAALFPEKIEELDIEKRNNIISSWEDGLYNVFLNSIDKKFYELESDFETKLVDYIIKNNLG